MRPDGLLMPLLDYEETPPEDIGRDCPALAGSFRKRGTPCMLASAHLAKQMLDVLEGSTVILDGDFVRDPLHGAITATLRRPSRPCGT